jgi:hypothetical protein
MADRSQERPLFIAPQELAVGVMPNRNVSLRLGPPHPSLGFAPGIVFAVELSPAESRDLASRLMRKADEAEGGSSQ